MACQVGQLCPSWLCDFCSAILALRDLIWELSNTFQLHTAWMHSHTTYSSPFIFLLRLEFWTIILSGWRLSCQRWVTDRKLSYDELWLSPLTFSPDRIVASPPQPRKYAWFARLTRPVRFDGVRRPLGGSSRSKWSSLVASWKPHTK